MRIEEKKETDRAPVSVILPACNEEDAIASQIESIRYTLRSHGIIHEIIVVDDGSQDQTAELALKSNARVILHPENRGYGAALKTGIAAAEYETILIIDADGTYPVEQIPNLLSKLETADMVVGARTGNKVHIPLIRRPAKWILGWLANRISGRSIPDLNSGMRVFRRDFVKQYFSILPNQFSFTTTITLAMLADDYHVVYHPIDYYRRIGNSKITPRNFMEFMMLVLRLAMLFQPLKIFVPLSFSFGLLGVLKAIFDIIGLFQRASSFNSSLVFQPVLSTSAILLLLVALQLLLIGMVADGLVRRIVQNNRPMMPSHAPKPFESASNPRLQERGKISNVKK